MAERPRTTEKADSRYVYFIQALDGGLVKIGVAIDPLVRLVNLQAACPVRLRILGCIRGGLAQERSLHRLFDEERRHFEWFEPTERLTVHIANLIAKEGVPREIYEAPGPIYRPSSVVKLVGRDD